MSRKSRPSFTYAIEAQEDVTVSDVVEQCMRYDFSVRELEAAKRRQIRTDFLAFLKNHDYVPLDPEHSEVWSPKARLFAMGESGIEVVEAYADYLMLKGQQVRDQGKRLRTECRKRRAALGI